MQCVKKILCFCLAFFFSFLYSESKDSPTIVLSHTQPEYKDSLQIANPNIDFQLSEYSSALRVFVEGKNVSLFAIDAIPLASAHPDYSFTPHYIQTVVIAVDRDQTTEVIESWKDVLTSKQHVSFSFGKDIGLMVWNTPSNFHIVTAMANALYGSYNINAISQDFRMLNENGRFFTNDVSKPISIMYDSQAVALLQQGRNIEIIFPEEGTLSFISGVLHKEDLSIDNNALNNALIENGLRLLDGRANSYYPSAEKYNKATLINDDSEYNRAIASIDSIMRRDSFDVRRYGMANNKERTFGYIICIVVVILYLISVYLRVAQKNIRETIMLICSIELLLATTQYIKALVSGMPILETFLWYAFYFSFILMPAFFVYVAIITGKSPEKNNLSLPYKIYFLLSCLFISFVATNNFHGQVFDIYDHYHTYFDYNWGYYVVMTWIYGSIVFALALLIFKSFQNPRKWAFILPILSSIFASLYTIGVILRIPIARDFEVGYGTAIVLLLFIEACIQSRLFPVNKGYNKLFSKSSLRMEIHNTKNMLTLRSENIENINENYILQKSSINGGSFLFYEDYTTLNETNKELTLNNKKLEKNNAVLEKKGKIEAELATLSVQKEIYKDIDAIIIRDTKKISALLENMGDKEHTHKTICHINIIACGLKRECILRINTLHKKNQIVYDFLNYIHEMSEFASAVPLKITIGSTIHEDITIQQALLMYEVFRLILESAVQSNCNNIVVQLYENKTDIVFSIIANEDIAPYVNLRNLKQRTEALTATLITKPWDDTKAFLLSFQRNGGKV